VEQKQTETLVLLHFGQGFNGMPEPERSSKIPYDRILEEIFYGCWKAGSQADQHFDFEGAAEFLVNIPEEIGEGSIIGHMTNAAGYQFEVYWDGQTPTLAPGEE